MRWPACCLGLQIEADVPMGHNLVRILFLFLCFHSLSVKEKVFVGEDSSNSRFVASEARSSLG